MNAKLVAPNGHVDELTTEQYIELKSKLIEQLPTRSERVCAIFNLIDEINELRGYDEAWWDEFEAELKENRLSYARWYFEQEGN